MEKKSFAFKLADENPTGARKWTARDGVAVAGCSEVPLFSGNYRASLWYSDNSFFC